MKETKQELSELLKRFYDEKQSVIEKELLLDGQKLFDSYPAPVMRDEDLEEIKLRIDRHVVRIQRIHARHRLSMIIAAAAVLLLCVYPFFRVKDEIVVKPPISQGNSVPKQEYNYAGLWQDTDSSSIYDMMNEVEVIAGQIEKIRLDEDGSTYYKSQYDMEMEDIEVRMARGDFWKGL